MFKTLRLLAHMRGRPEWLKLGDKMVQVRGLDISTSPALLSKLDVEGVRAANRAELERFVEKYQPTRLLTIHAVDAETTITALGPVARLYATTQGKVEHVAQNILRGIPQGSLILYVKEGE